VGFHLPIANFESLMKKSIFTKIIREEVSRLFEAEPTQALDPTKPPAEDGSDAAAQAHNLNLTHIGYGYWADKSGQTVARTVKGHLVKLSDKDKTEMGNKSSAPAGKEAPTVNVPSTKGVKSSIKSIDADDYTSPTPYPLGQQRTQKIQAKAIDPAYAKRIPGSITPPKTKEGKPWEVSVNGKQGLVDFTLPERDAAHVTFNDGTFGLFRTNQLQSKKAG
jgi:hypothetical protein